MNWMAISSFVFVLSLSFVEPITSADAAPETVLYSFCSQADCADGASPLAAPTDVNDILYGTTEKGGTETCSCGTVFSFNLTTLVETVVYSFKGAPDSAFPDSSLIYANGALYGTTTTGGTGTNCTPEVDGCGSVFSVDPTTGTETVLHSFQADGTDGNFPQAALLYANGLLYGTTRAGGQHNEGIIFSINPKTSIEKVLYSFCSQQNCADGAFPVAPLTVVKDIFYGTTALGGANCSCGTVFAFDPKNATETVLYPFCSQRNCVDGEQPVAGLLDAMGALYGTAAWGGEYGYGTGFSLDPNTGIANIEYQFGKTKGSAGPDASLIEIDKTLYSTTGGSYRKFGEVFSLKPKTDKEKVLHSFHGSRDGAVPSGLVAVQGVLYGTTERGGDNCGRGCGTIFAIVP